MNVEKTVEFILQMQAKAESEMAAMRDRQAKTDRQISAIQKLIHTGMRMIVKQEENIRKQGEHIDELTAGQKELRAELKELAKTQRVTETKLQGLIDALRRGGNGTRRH